MLSILLLFITSAFCSPLAIGQFDVHVQDPHQNALHYADCTVYFPSNAPSGAQYPLLVFSPGFTESHTFYEYLWTGLVPNGYVVAVMSTFDYDPISLPLWKARDQSFINGIWLDQSIQTNGSDRICFASHRLGYLKNQSSSNSSSPIYNLLSGKSAAGGHSEGGAASFISGAPGTNE